MRLAHDDAGNGPVVLLLHGFPFDRTMWRAQAAGLSPRYRVIAPDLPGFGGSPPPEDAGGGSIASAADAVVGLLDDLKVTEPVVLGGLSMGGYVALAALARHRPRFHALVLMDTRATADTPEAAEARETNARSVLEANSVTNLVGAMLPRLLAPQTLQDRPEAVESVRAMMLRTTPEAAARALRWMAERPDRTEMLGSIDVPTLVVSGSDDAVTPPHDARVLAAAIPGASCLLIPGAGHLPPVETPDACNAGLLAFLDGLRPARRV